MIIKKKYLEFWLTHSTQTKGVWIAKTTLSKSDLQWWPSLFSVHTCFSCLRTQKGPWIVYKMVPVHMVLFLMKGNFILPWAWILSQIFFFKKNNSFILQSVYIQINILQQCLECTDFNCDQPPKVCTPTARFLALGIADLGIEVSRQVTHSIGSLIPCNTRHHNKAKQTKSQPPPRPI